MGLREQDDPRGPILHRRCYACEAELPVQYNCEDTGYQYDNNLWVEFHGGYGMFTDWTGPDPNWEEPKVTVCHKCAHELCDKIPWIAKLLRPMESHSHTYTRIWGGHPGWDMPHTNRLGYEEHEEFNEKGDTYVEPGFNQARIS